MSTEVSPKSTGASPKDWSPDSWRTFPVDQQIDYPDAGRLRESAAELRNFPPLVTSWEIETLRQRLADAAEGKRFLLQGGDCAETFAECRSDLIANKLKILLQMSLVLVQGLKKPVVKIGRFAGQYAKPRSSPQEKKKGPDGAEQTLASYYGDMINSVEFTEASRTPDPYRLVKAFKHSAMTLNFIRSLIDGGFTDLHHPEYWDLSFLDRAGLPEQLRTIYRETTRSISSSIEFMEAVGEQRIHRITRAEFYTSHEGLSLEYESALTRTVPRREGYYDLSCHLPWIGERTRRLDGGHMEFFRGVRNPVGVKIGPKITPEELTKMADLLDPEREPGRLMLIARMGAGKPKSILPPLIQAMRKAGRAPVWMCDPMHANTKSTSTGIKTRHFDDVLADLRESMAAHASEGSVLGGVHFELTGENVTECTGGMSGVTEADLDTNYQTLCDPRLNYEQAMEMAYAIAAGVR